MGALVDSSPEFPAGRHDPCTCCLVGKGAKTDLAIRTVAVTTRAAVRSHMKRGNTELAAESATRGLVLLDQLGETFDDDVSRQTRDLFEAARRELAALATGDDAGITAVSIEPDDSPVQEDVDVRP